MIRVFAGYDPREAAGATVFAQSLRETSPGVSLTWLTGEQRDGTNAFNHERFSVPERCKWQGWAIYVDGSDMLLRENLEQLWALRDPRYAVQVVQHSYRTQFPRKYVGTEMEAANVDYPRKNWSSVMLLNNEHPSHFLHRDAIRAGDGQFRHRFGWLADGEIGALPAEWNWLADEAGFNGQAKLVHWTTGIPGFLHHREAPHGDEFRATLERALRGLQTHRLEDTSRNAISER